MFEPYLKVEIADTPSSQERGLMFRSYLDEDSGMLFKFNNPRNLMFWGVNTYLPLDIAFVSPENVIVKIDNIRPLDNKNISSDVDCAMAIEANMGYFSQNDIGVGSKIEIEGDRVVFNKGGQIAVSPIIEG